MVLNGSVASGGSGGSGSSGASGVPAAGGGDASNTPANSEAAAVAPVTVTAGSDGSGESGKDVGQGGVAATTSSAGAGAPHHHVGGSGMNDGEEQQVMERESHVTDGDAAANVPHPSASSSSSTPSSEGNIFTRVIRRRDTREKLRLDTGESVGNAGVQQGTSKPSPLTLSPVSPVSPSQMQWQTQNAQQGQTLQQVQQQVQVQQQHSHLHQQHHGQDVTTRSSQYSVEEGGLSVSGDPPAVDRAAKRNRSRSIKTTSSSKSSRSSTGASVSVPVAATAVSGVASAVVTPAAPMGLPPQAVAAAPATMVVNEDGSVQVLVAGVGVGVGVAAPPNLSVVTHLLPPMPVPTPQHPHHQQQHHQQIQEIPLSSSSSPVSTVTPTPTPVTAQTLASNGTVGVFLPHEDEDDVSRPGEMGEMELKLGGEEERVVLLDDESVVGGVVPFGVNTDDVGALSSAEVVPPGEESAGAGVDAEVEVEVEVGEMDGYATPEMIRVMMQEEEQESTGAAGADVQQELQQHLQKPPPPPQSQAQQQDQSATSVTSAPPPHRPSRASTTTTHSVVSGISGISGISGAGVDQLTEFPPFVASDDGGDVDGRRVSVATFESRGSVVVVGDGTVVGVGMEANDEEENVGVGEGDANELTPTRPVHPTSSRPLPPIPIDDHNPDAKGVDAPSPPRGENDDAETSARMGLEFVSSYAGGDLEEGGDDELAREGNAVRAARFFVGSESENSSEYASQSARASVVEDAVLDAAAEELDEGADGDVEDNGVVGKMVMGVEAEVMQSQQQSQQAVMVIEEERPLPVLPTSLSSPALYAAGEAAAGSLMAISIPRLQQHVTANTGEAVLLAHGRRSEGALSRVRSHPNLYRWNNTVESGVGQDAVGGYWDPAERLPVVSTTATTADGEQTATSGLVVGGASSEDYERLAQQMMDNFSAVIARAGGKKSASVDGHLWKSRGVLPWGEDGGLVPVTQAAAGQAAGGGGNVLVFGSERIEEWRREREREQQGLQAPTPATLPVMTEAGQASVPAAVEVVRGASGTALANVVVVDETVGLGAATSAAASGTRLSAGSVLSSSGVVDLPEPAVMPVAPSSHPAGVASQSESTHAGQQDTSKADKTAHVRSKRSISNLAESMKDSVRSLLRRNKTSGGHGEKEKEKSSKKGYKSGSESEAAVAAAVGALNRDDEVVQREVQKATVVQDVVPLPVVPVPVPVVEAPAVVVISAGVGGADGTEGVVLSHLAPAPVLAPQPELAAESDVASEDVGGEKGLRENAEDAPIQVEEDGAQNTTGLVGSNTLPRSGGRRNHLMGRNGDDDDEDGGPWPIFRSDTILSGLTDEAATNLLNEIAAMGVTAKRATVAVEPSAGDIVAVLASASVGMGPERITPPSTAPASQVGSPRKEKEASDMMGEGEEEELHEDVDGVEIGQKGVVTEPSDVDQEKESVQQDSAEHHPANQQQTSVGSSVSGVDHSAVKTQLLRRPARTVMGPRPFKALPTPPSESPIRDPLASGPPNPPRKSLIPPAFSSWQQSQEAEVAGVERDDEEDGFQSSASAVASSSGHVGHDLDAYATQDENGRQELVHPENQLQVDHRHQESLRQEPEGPSCTYAWRRSRSGENLAKMFSGGSSGGVDEYGASSAMMDGHQRQSIRRTKSSFDLWKMEGGGYYDDDADEEGDDGDGAWGDDHDGDDEDVGGAVPRLSPNRKRGQAAPPRLRKVMSHAVLRRSPASPRGTGRSSGGSSSRAVASPRRVREVGNYSNGSARASMNDGARRRRNVQNSKGRRSGARAQRAVAEGDYDDELDYEDGRYPGDEEYMDEEGDVDIGLGYGRVIGRFERRLYAELIDRCESMAQEIRDLKQKLRDVEARVATPAEGGSGGAGAGVSTARNEEIGTR
ncbi:hypothetical protein HK102_013533 [Quaeritorhiza haematococci]|nr:hypothetical protein HK102_013533 [Quaeritorhiza haematococci]